MRRKKHLIIIILISIILTLLVACSKSDNNGKSAKIIVNETEHSVFYAPMYIAIEEGYFKEEGIDITLITEVEQGKIISALSSGEVYIGLMGPEESIYTYNEGTTDYLMNFAQLTQRAGAFLVIRDNVDSTKFSWEQVKDKTILVGKKSSIASMTFEYILKKQGIDPKNDVNIVNETDANSTVESFINGQGDFIIVSESEAYSLEIKGVGTMVMSLSIDSGMIPYTTYLAKKSYIDSNPETIQKFTNAIQKGLIYVNQHNSEEIIDVIKLQFDDIKEDILIKIIESYKTQNIWKEDAIISESSFKMLQNIIEEAEQLSKRVNYNDIVNTKFAEETVK